MKAEKYKVILAGPRSKEVFIWDPQTPRNLDAHFHWVLENSNQGVRIRYLGGNNNKIIEKSAILINPSANEAQSNTTLTTENGSKLTVSLQKLSRLQAPYLEAEGKQGNQLIAFSGIGHGLLQSHPIHAAYVGYVRRNPIFTVHQDGESYRITPLLDGVRLKLKGQKSNSGKIGQEWTVDQSQITHCTLIRGSYWWKFSSIASDQLMEDFDQLESLDENQTKTLLRNLGIFALLFALLTVAVVLTPSTEKTTPVVVEPPVVQFIAPPKSKVIRPTPPPTPKPIEKTPVKLPELPKKVEKPAVKPVQKKTPPPPAPAPAPKKPEPPRPLPPVVAKPDPKVIAAQAAAKRVAELRQFMGGALSLTQKEIKINTNPTGNTPLFNGSTTLQAATEVKAGYVSRSSGVSAIGGTGNSGSVGYSKGERAAAQSGSLGFAPVGAAEVKVEKGLTQEEVGAAIHSHMDEVRYCHDTAMLYHPHLEGKLLISFSITASGQVTQISVKSTDLPEKVLETCIIKKLATWKFPKPKGGIQVAVTYPFIFKSLGSDS